MDSKPFRGGSAGVTCAICDTRPFRNLLRHPRPSAFDDDGSIESPRTGLPAPLPLTPDAEGAGMAG